MTKDAERPGLARVIDHALSVVKDARERRRLRRELLDLDADTLDRTLAELRLQRGEVDAMIANHPASGHLLDDVAARLDVAGKLHADPATERDMWRLCSVCSAQGRCKHWLASGATEGYDEFCPNADRLDALRRAPDGDSRGRDKLG